MKKIFPQTIKWLAASASLLGLTIAHAIQINPAGDGEVLLFPYYTVRNNSITLISLVNTLPSSKVVRVNVQEGKNGGDMILKCIFPLTMFGLRRSCRPPTAQNW